MSDIEWLRSVIVCPRDRSAFVFDRDRVSCAHGHEYAIVEDVPILLVSDVEQTHPAAEASLEVARSWLQGDLRVRDLSGLYLETIGISAEEKAGSGVPGRRRRGPWTRS